MFRRRIVITLLGISFLLYVMYVNYNVPQQILRHCNFLEQQQVMLRTRKYKLSRLSECVRETDEYIDYALSDGTPLRIILHPFSLCHFVTSEDVRNITWLAGLMFGEGAAVEIPETYEPEKGIIVQIRGLPYLYENETLTAIQND